MLANSSFPLGNRRHYLTIRQCAEFVNPYINPNKKSKRPDIEPTIRRKVEKAYDSQKYGDGIINLTNGKTNRFLLVERETLLQILRGGRP